MNTLQPPREASPSLFGDVTVDDGAVLAPGAVLRADPGASIRVAAGACIGQGVILHASGGALTVEAGAVLGEQVLLVGKGTVGAAACIGRCATLLDPAVAPGALVEPNALIGDRSRPRSAEGPRPLAVGPPVGTPRPLGITALSVTAPVPLSPPASAPPGSADLSPPLAVAPPPALAPPLAPLASGPPTLASPPLVAPTSGPPTLASQPLAPLASGPPVATLPPATGASPPAAAPVHDPVHDPVHVPAPPTPDPVPLPPALADTNGTNGTGPAAESEGGVGSPQPTPQTMVPGEAYLRQLRRTLFPHAEVMQLPGGDGS